MTENLKQLVKKSTTARPPQSQATDPLVGKKLGTEYQIVELLGQGAMARVYKAKHLPLDRMVAIKILTSDAPDLVARFVHEIKVHSLLKHSNIVEALDCVTDARTGQTCFVMEFLDGTSLQHVVRSNPEGVKAEEDIYFVISEVARALSYAHKQGVIHRDLKPANMVFVEVHEQLQVKVVDFGMARLQEQLQRFTKTGHIVGSPLYMSPEQCMGKELDPRSDVYALGLVTYEMATGKAPYAGAPTLYDVMQSHCDPEKKPEPISTKNPHLRLSGRLDAIISIALETNPDWRFQTVKLFEEALKSWHDAVKKGMTEEEVDMIPIVRGDVSSSTQCVDTSQSLDGVGSLAAAISQSAPAVKSAAKPPAIAKPTSVAKDQKAPAEDVGSTFDNADETIEPRALQLGAEQENKAIWRIPEMVSTHHGGDWGMVSGQELSYIRQCEPLVGQLLNQRFRIHEMIGEGGMSIVYRAQDQQTGKMVAVKSLKFVDAELAQRFSREINLHLELKHPNIVKAIERVQTVNQTFFVMELLSGTVLEDYLEREFCVSSFNDICTIIAQICDALEFAHDQDVIHRDLKPGNVMLIDQAGALRVKVLDFGLAQIQDEMQRLTRTGVLVGSPAYMSPEHCLGRDLTCQSDMYSLGVLAFELVSGELPFRGESDIEIVKAHCDKNLVAMRLSEFRQDLPAIDVLEKVLAKALEKDVEKRYASVEEFRKDLDGWWQAACGNPEETPFKERRRRKRKIKLQEETPASQVNEPAKNAAPAAKPSVQEKVDLSSIVDNYRQGQVETVTSKWRDDTRFQQSPAKTIKMVVITIVIFCLLGTIVWFSMQQKPETLTPKPETISKESVPSATTPAATSIPDATATPPVAASDDDEDDTMPRRKMRIPRAGVYERSRH